MEIIRKAKREDIAVIRTVKPILTEAQIIERLEKQKKGDSDYLVLEKDGAIVSFVVLKWQGKETHPEYPDMEDLFTKLKERGKGYGTRLIKECERLAKARGFKKIGLAANPDLNQYAEQLYEKLGYKHDGKKSYVDGVYDGTEDWVVDLEKEI